jgi:hypothetical protein
MDAQQASIVAFCGLAVSVITAIVGAINHKRIRSNCLGAKGEISIDIENTTPVNSEPKIAIPK